MAGQNPSEVGTRRFDKGLNEDVNDYHLPENEWTHARNAVNNSNIGDLGKLGNERANLSCLSKSLNKPYTIIGTLHITADKWLIYSTDDIDSEIGIFQEDLCGKEDAYTTVVNDRCLAFNRLYLIKGVVRATSQCTYKSYWDDGNNLSRAIEFDAFNLDVNPYTNPNSSIPWIQTCTDSNGLAQGGCIICVNTPALDCDKIRMAPFMQKPCALITKGVGAGTLLNGSYMIALAYAINGVKVSDWYVSNVQALFTHGNYGSSLNVQFGNMDKDFSEVQVAIISIVANQTVVRSAGIYSTNIQRFSFDTIDPTWPNVPIENIPILTPVVDKTDSMYSVGDYLIRVGPTYKEDFNYQPIANRIVAKWQSVEYPVSYYRTGGNNTQYMRDEIYPFFIRWVFNTGDRSSLFHIPGRPTFAGSSELNTTTTDALPGEFGNANPIDNFNYNWYINNTATQTASFPQPPNPGAQVLPDGGVVIAEGFMGYWESSEYYPDTKPQVWNGFTNPLGNGFNVPVSPYLGTNAVELDLCGRPIRHHKFPDLELSSQTQYYDEATGKIRLMGVKFENIDPPLMNDGVTPVPGIVGYEILRGARNGNKTILAKGLICNMGLYDLPEGASTGNTKGAYVNYPYNETRLDPFLTTIQNEGGGCSIAGNLINPEQPLLGDFSRTLVSFHSPDTTFSDPYLSTRELKIHGEMNGDVLGKFEYSEEHPKEKLITNVTFIISAIGGIGLAALAANGKKTTKYASPKSQGYSASNIPGIGYTTTTGGTFTPPAIALVNTVTAAAGATNVITSPSFLDRGIPTVSLISIANTAVNATWNAQNNLQNTGVILLQQLTGLTQDEGVGTNAAYISWLIAQNGTKAMSSRSKDIDQESGELSGIPRALRIAAGVPLFINNFTRGTDQLLEFFKSVIRYRDFALRYHSHGFYTRFRPSRIGNRRFEIQEALYMGPQITNFNTSIRVNNLLRANTVGIQVNPNKPILPTLVDDVTRIRASDVDSLWEPEFPMSLDEVLKHPESTAFGRGSAYRNTILPGNNGIQIASSHYASLKQRMRNQYGQIGSIAAVPASNCLYIGNSTDAVFGGDTYVGRYTEKNTFFYFYNWLYGQPDGAQLDYTKQVNVPFPRYFANFEEFETGDFISSLSNLFSPGIITNPASTFNGLVVPSDYYKLDGDPRCSGDWTSFVKVRFAVRYQYFYLFNSSVKDFFVESEINVDLRDWEDTIDKQHYDPYRYTDTKSLFDTKIIKDVNFYKYDSSLSIAKLFLNYVSWGAVQQRSFDPYVAETCYVYNETRVLYSLPSVFENIHDSWTNFLANNYYDFNTRVTCIKPVNKNGALIFFEGESPAQFFGTDQLQTTGGTKLTIGDGGLFDQPLQNVINADIPYEYGSCQDRLSVINTPAGVFWISQNQNKIFTFTGSIEEISMQNIKWWLINYLQYQLLKQFPNFDTTENPVVGIGGQSIYDNQNGLLYFCKRDYQVRTDLSSDITIVYIGGMVFEVQSAGSAFRINLGDPRYFEDASWTISYDPKSKSWISYHDWHPSLLMPGKNTFMSVKDNDIWVHNSRTDKYCNYYGKDYPFEIEYMVDTVQTVTTLRSIQYQLESYKYAPNGFDRFQVLDFNFDEAVVYNTEQVSGLLKMTPNPKQDPFAMISYPKVNFDNIEILCSKQENNFRFNQFWDVTADRGEYNPNAQRMMWNTQANGYVRNLNVNNMNYGKDEFQRKKFRHYLNYVFLRKNVCNDRKMLILITNNKELNSPR